MEIAYFFNIKDLPNNPLFAVRKICDEFDSMDEYFRISQEKVRGFYELNDEMKDIYFDFYNVLKNIQEKHELDYVPIELYTIDPNQNTCIEFIRRTFEVTRKQIAEPLEKYKEVRKFLDSKNRIANTMGFIQEENRRVERIKHYLHEINELKECAQDFIEANEVLYISPNASAALSRRCLQYIIREKAQIRKNTLDNEIQELLSSNTLPSYIAESVDAVRVIGNFAAHPQKSSNTDRILPVEEGEAEWVLDVVEALLDHYFIKPHLVSKKKDLFNRKLTEAGKKRLL